VSDYRPEHLGEAEALLRAGRVGQAVGVLREMTARRSDDAAAQEMLAVALERSGDRVGAEHALRASLAAEPGRPGAAARLVNLLTATYRAEEAIKLLAPFMDAATDGLLLTAYGSALKSEGRMDDAVTYYERARQALPMSPEAEHNLAGALGDAHLFAESARVVGRAFDKGLDAPETWLVQGRSLVGLGRFDEAEDSFREAIRRRPHYPDAHAELAQLIWMRTEDADAASEGLDEALRTRRDDLALTLVKARLLEYAVGEGAAYEILGDLARLYNLDAAVQTAAARLSLSIDPETALAHAKRAVAVAPKDAPAMSALAQANLALGRPEPAAEIAEELRSAWPNDQQPLAILAIAWRMLGDPRYHQLYDYQRLVRPYEIETPAGWPKLKAYLADLAEALKRLQRLRGHPVGQSLRQGAQTGQMLTRSEDPAIQAFFAAVDAPIRAYIAVLAKRPDELGRRVSKGYRFTGAWSVLLQPGGRHVDHIHQLGWISSAFHVELPAAVDKGHEGWLKFGEPGMPTRPWLEPEHHVKPKAGTLVLFPSYMWHGTVPFSGAEPRLTIAFDAVPA
jgi:tetratricopeptide (TPR) repeat protein